MTADLRPLIRMSVVIALVAGTGDVLQMIFDEPADPLGWAAATWALAAGLLWSSQRALAHHQLKRATRLFTTGGLTIAFLLPLFESPYGAILALTLGPIYVMLSIGGFPDTENSRRRWPVWFGMGSTLGIVLRHQLRPLPGFDNAIDLVFAALSAGLVVFAISSIAGKLLQETQDARDTAQSALDSLTRNHEALVLSRDEALAASRAKASFLANMSHELRTPLNAILGYVELMEEEADLPTDAHADLSNISTAGHHLLSTITEILDLSRIEAGQTIIELGWANVRTLCTEATTVVRPLARRGSTLTSNAPDTPILTDGPRLRQVLVNLLGNAAKFTDHGTITLLVEPHARAEQAGYSFRVLDTGRGIEPERLESIFEPFNTSGNGGSGIGLTVSRAIALQLGGSLTATSELGVGSAFTLWIPARKGKRRHTPRTESGAPLSDDR